MVDEVSFPPLREMLQEHGHFRNFPPLLHSREEWSRTRTHNRTNFNLDRCNLPMDFARFHRFGRTLKGLNSSSVCFLVELDGLALEITASERKWCFLEPCFG
ncbi:hypothetical protein NE237_020257 [Protea cynaroides]|uniref:Uncharacterized protein n=1 Tax=Protea cynaroides TaxID=273540 RepID=A0A9Q0K2F0_9MAGN|nr:hypothetical protein NE237_020257 [Protea cynaroides]